MALKGKCILGRVECEVLTFLLENEERQKRSGEIQFTPRKDVYKALVEDFFSAKRKHLAVVDPKLFLANINSRKCTIRRALSNLERKGLIKYAVLKYMDKAESGFILTERGYEVAVELRDGRVLEKREAMKWAKKMEKHKNCVNAVKEALKKLKAEGRRLVTLEDVREALWSLGGWGGRDIFDARWTKKRIGNVLRILGLGSRRKKYDGKRIKVYILPEDLPSS